MKRRWLLLIILAVAALVICITILLDWTPLFRGPVSSPGEWSWPYDLRPVQRWWLPVMASLLIVAVAAWWLFQEEARPNRTRVALLALVTGSLLLQIGLIYADRPAISAELVDRALADQTTGYYRTAADNDDIGSLLANYPAAMPQFDSEHVRTHPPGLVITNWLIIRLLAHLPALSNPLSSLVLPLRCTDLWLLEKPNQVAAGLAVTAILPLLLASLTIPLAYMLAKKMMDHRSARLAALLVATLPALLLFSPLADQVLAFLSVAGLLLLILAIRSRRVILFFVSGLTMALASFISLGSLAILVIGGILFVAVAWKTNKLEPGAPRWIQWGIAFLAGLLLPWFLYWLLYGVAPWQIVRTALDQHYQLVTSRRNYGLWLGFNLVDLIIFTGLPVIFGFVGALLLAIRQTRQKRLTVTGSLSLALALVILLLLFSGSTRGEVGRIWLFFMPLLAISSASFLTGWLPGQRSALVLVVLQVLLVLSLGLAWRPVEAVIVVAEKPVMEAPPVDIRPLAITFEEEITLAGFSLDSESFGPGDVARLTLLWQSEGATDRPYTVFAHIIDAEGNLVSQQDNWPVEGQWPSTCWQPGQQVVDPRDLHLPLLMTPGAYQLVIGLYDANDGRRLQTESGSEAIDLTTIHIDPSP